MGCFITCMKDLTLTTAFVIAHLEHPINTEKMSNNKRLDNGYYEIGGQLENVKVKLSKSGEACYIYIDESAFKREKATIQEISSVIGYVSNIFPRDAWFSNVQIKRLIFTGIVDTNDLTTSEYNYIIDGNEIVIDYTDYTSNESVEQIKIRIQSEFTPES